MASIFLNDSTNTHRLVALSGLGGSVIGSLMKIAQNYCLRRHHYYYYYSEKKVLAISSFFGSKILLQLEQMVRTNFWTESKTARDSSIFFRYVNIYIIKKKNHDKILQLIRMDRPSHGEGSSQRSTRITFVRRNRLAFYTLYGCSRFFAEKGCVKRFIYDDFDDTQRGLLVSLRVQGEPPA